MKKPKRYYKQKLLELWYWLHKNPKKSKAHYCNVVDRTLKNMECYCPSCEYAHMKDNLHKNFHSCEYCLIDWHIPFERYDGLGSGYMCERSDFDDNFMSPYGKWLDAQEKGLHRTASIYALEVYKLCLQIKTK